VKDHDSQTGRPREVQDQTNIEVIPDQLERQAPLEAGGDWSVFGGAGIMQTEIEQAMAGDHEQTEVERLSRI